MRTATRKNVLVFRELPPDQLARLQAQHDVTVANPRLPGQLPAFEAALAMAEGMIGSSYPITEALVARAPQLKVISSVSVGVDNYALGALAARGIVLCHTPGVLTETTADTIFSLIMATSRRLVELASHVREGRWSRNIGEDLFGWDVHGKTLGILGFGRIGQAVARRAALGFGMPVLYPTGIGMAFELAAYGAVIGLLYAKLNKRGVAGVYMALVPAMLAGRAVWGVAQTVLLG